jgi:hypothetical protein
MNRRWFRLCLSLFLLCISGLASITYGQPLRVSPDKHHLVRQDGSPFFYLGDTAWELFHRLNREEADYYLENRAQKGFTVIQAVVLAELDGLSVPNPYGQLPLVNNDPTKINEAYFEHVDYIINKAESLGLYVGLLPTWGDKFNKRWGSDSEIFTSDNARVYGEFLGKRYKNKPIIWIMGGDRSPENEQHFVIIRAMAEGIRKSVGNTQLFTYHPMGGTNSATYFHQDAWLDMNMFQSGHNRLDIPNYEMTLANYQLSPIKPTVDGEPRYEDHPINWKPENGWFEDFDVRQAAYWSMLSGACGHTYGNHNIWQFWQKGRQPISAARTPWREAMDQPGAFEMGLLRSLFESRPWQRLVPDQTMVQVSDSTAKQVRAARADDGSFLMVYLPNAETVKVDLTKLKAKSLVGWWYNPKSGAVAKLGKVRGSGFKEFDPPGEGFRGNDWVLIIDDASKSFPAPGQGREY